METRTRSSTTALTGTRPGSRRREVDHGDLVWLDQVQPNANDGAYLRERFGMDALLLEDIVSTTQPPKLNTIERDQTLLLVLHIPTLDRDSHVLLSEVKLIVGRSSIVSIHDGTLKPLRRLFAAVSTDEAARAQLLGRGPGYLLYRILDTLVKHCFPVVYRIDDELDQLDTRVFERDPRRVVRDLGLTKRDIVTLHQMMSGNSAVLETLRNVRTEYFRLDGSRYFGHCLDELRRLRDMVEEQQQVADSLIESLSIATVQRTHRALNTLALMAVALAPLVMLGALAGLNAIVPFAQQPLIFLAILLLVVAAVIGTVVYLRFRDWP
jgi:magnesium transporter